MVDMSETARPWVRPQDFVWLLLFGGLAIASPDRSAYEIELLIALAALQLVEPRVPYFSTSRGMVVLILLKLAAGFLLIGFTGGITSSYHLILLLPVVSAATSLGLLGSMLCTGLACASYLIFMHPVFLDPQRWELTREGIGVLSLRVIFLPVVAFLTNELARANREAAKRYQATAAELAAANKSLQEATDAMRRTERLAALGQLSAGLAHELRNPLGTVKASAEMLERNLSQGDDVSRELAGFITSEVDRANSLVTKFLDFARPLRMQRRVADLSDALDRAVDQLARHVPPFPVTVYKNYSPDIRPFPMDSQLIERVAFNLLLNAAQASPAGAAITLRTRQAENFAEIAVIDRGSGVDPAHRESIFNPFFTTKREGVGLGLPIVAKIVDEHGGRITLESDPGVGSVFRVLLPVDAPETPQ